jgi:uridylate kinase
MDGRPEINRLLLKVSGEVFKGEYDSVDFNKVEKFAGDLMASYRTGAEIAVVIGGGNIIRGGSTNDIGIERVTADYMGMLGTIINALALDSALNELGVDSRVMTSMAMEQLAEPYIRRNAIKYLDDGKLIILAGGTGNPYFTTDTAAALRAAEIKADTLLKGTKVDGIYRTDPMEDPHATMFKELGYTDVLKENLGVMDAAAVALCRDNGIPIIVFNILETGNIKRVIEGEELGTIVY